MAEKKKKQKQKKEPYNKSFSVSLPSGKIVKVNLSHTCEQIQKPVRVESGVEHFDSTTWLPKLRKVRDNEGNFIMAPVKVQGCRVSLTFDDGTKLEGRSCCKPPDVFRSSRGFSHAYKRVCKMDSGISLNKYEKHGKLVRDRTVKPRLNKADRQALYDAIKRRGRPRTGKISVVPESSETIQNVKKSAQVKQPR